MPIPNHIFEIHTWAMLGTTPIALFIGIRLLVRYKLPSAVYLGLMEIAIAVWAFFAFWESAAQTVPLKIFWSKLAYIGTPTSPLLFFFFVLAYTRNEKFLTLKNIVVFSIIPVIAILLSFTNEWHHLIWTGVEINPQTNIGFYHHGIFFFVYLGYVYVLLMLGFILLLQSFRRLAKVFKSQIYVLLLGLCLPFIANIIYVFDLNPLRGFDWTPVSFMLSGLLLAIGLYYYRFFEIVPVARNQLVDSIENGVLVLDVNKRIADCNPAMQKILEQDQKCHGKSFNELPVSIQNILSKMLYQQLQSYETSLELGGEKKYYEIHLTHLDSRTATQTGHLFVFHDVSQILKLRKFSDYLLYSQESERAAVAKDIHDNLGQTLLALKMDLNWIKNKVGDVQPELSPHVMEMDAHFSEMLHKVQDIIGELHPTLLDDLGLSETVDWYVKEYQRKTGIRCIANVEFEILPPGDLAIKIYRVIQELFNHVIDPKSTRLIEIQLKKQNNFLVFMVDLNGYNLEKISDAEFSGMAGIRERLAAISGAVDISYFGNTALKIILTVPVA